MDYGGQVVDAVTGNAEQVPVLKFPLSESVAPKLMLYVPVYPVASTRVTVRVPDTDWKVEVALQPASETANRAVATFPCAVLDAACV